MRYRPGHKAATRERLLDAAGALSKQNGFGTTGVDALVAAAGLTAGAFYSHFGSKAGMLEALVDHELLKSLERYESAAGGTGVPSLASYLSLAHVEHPDQGCALPALAAEIARADESVRARFEERLLQFKDRIAAQTGDEDKAWSTLAQAVGAVMLARAMHSRPARKALLDGTLRSIAGPAPAAKRK
jgi:AcrR family transcriptional regulator